jgi:heme/copper-type cytochrome/quinol oxidase subunit 2
VSAAVLAFVTCAVCCVVAQAAILASVVRRPPGTADPGVPRPRLLVEVVWALVPALLLAFLLTATWVRVRDHSTPKPGVMMKVAR